MSDENEDRYRKKYLDLLGELDAKEKEWGELEGRLRRILTHLLIVADGPGSPEVSAELSRIKDTLKEGLDLGALERHVEALKERVLREGKWAETRADLPPVHHILIHLVERLPLPPEMAERSLKVVEGLEAGIGPDGLPEAVDAVAGLVLEVRQRVQQEKRELEALLQEITGRLQELDAGFQAAHRAAEGGFAASRTLDAAVRAEVQGLEANTRSAGDLESLRRAVSATLESIRGHLESKAREDAGHEQELRREVERLRDGISRLEHEVGEHREKTRLAREASLRDALTGCYNRLAYQERASVEETRWQRYRAPLSLVVLDVDHFKKINDSFGHRAGDQVLKAIAQIAGNQIRQADFFARYGGEEFVALLPETRLEQAALVAEKFRSSVESFRFHFRGSRVPITLSCGVAELRGEDTVDSAFQRADEALYRAKGAGRNRTVTEKENRAAG